MGCCAACPNPILYFLYWAEHDCKTDDDGCANKADAVDITTHCSNAKPVSMTDGGEITQWKAMCTTLNDTIGCSGLQNQDNYPYSDFNTCCVSCEKKDGENDPTPTQQMTCCAACPPETHTTTDKTGGTTTENPAPKSVVTTTAAPVTSAGKTTEDVSEATSTEQSTSIDTSAPLLPPYAICAKIIVITALILTFNHKNPDIREIRTPLR